MVKKVSYKIFTLFLTLLVLTTIFTSVTPTPALGEKTPEEQLKDIEDQIANLEKERGDIESEIAANEYIIAGYNSQVSKLYGEVEIFRSKLKQLELEIQELEISIQVLEKQIEEKRQEIQDSQQNIVDLEDESMERIYDSYISFKITGGATVNENNILNTESINEYFRDSQYISIIQDDTNSMLVELATLKIELERKENELKNNLTQVKKERDSIDVKRADLAKQKSVLDVKINEYYAAIVSVENQTNNLNQTIAVFSEEEAQLKAEYDRLMSAIFNSFTPTSNGEYVKAGKILGQQGCTGLCTGPHLHFIVWENGAYQNPCNYIAACGGGRLSMPIQSGYSITSWYGNRCFWWGGTNYCDFHNGLDMAATPWNAPVYAAHDGYAYKGTDVYGANYVVVCEQQGCGGGIKTGYWHLSSF